MQDNSENDSSKFKTWLLSGSLVLLFVALYFTIGSRLYPQMVGRRPIHLASHPSKDAKIDVNRAKIQEAN